MIKLMAAVLMLIDHIGFVFFPDVLAWRIIGRLSMPMFAYCLARGYEHIRMKLGLPRYYKRLLIFSAVSQLPYRFMTGGDMLNIGATWFFALAVLSLADKTRWKWIDYQASIILTSIGAVLSVIVVLNLAETDYGIYGILLPVVLWYFIVKRHNPCAAFAAGTALWGVYTVVYRGSLLNVVGLAAIPIAAIVERTDLDEKAKLPGAFYYIFYPAHIAILVIIKFLFTKGA